MADDPMGFRDFTPLLREADALLSNPISERLAEGWYPSVRDDSSDLGWAHDRHVLIWVRNYESLIRALAAAVRSLGDNDE